MTSMFLPPLDLLRRYSIAEACQYLGLSRPTVYRQMQAGELPIIKDGSRTFISGKTIAIRSGWTNEEVERLAARQRGGQ